MTIFHRATVRWADRLDQLPEDGGVLQVQLGGTAAVVLVLEPGQWGYGRIHALPHMPTSCFPFVQGLEVPALPGHRHHHGVDVVPDLEVAQVAAAFQPYGPQEPVQLVEIGESGPRGYSPVLLTSPKLKPRWYLHLER